MFFKKVLTPLLLMPLTYATSATSDEQMTQTVIAPSCFVENSSPSLLKLAKVEDFLLIQAKTTDLETIKEQNAQKACRFFRDVTPEWTEIIKNKNFSRSKLKASAKNFLSQEISSLKQSNRDLEFNPTSFTIQYQENVQEILTSFVKDRLWSDLQTLTSFQNRYANSDTGVQAAQWFQSQVQTLAQNANRTDITVQTIKTGSYKQPSVLVTVPGTDPSLEGVLLGGHMDTLSGTRPGADDDGSGAITVLESFRTILNSGKKFKRTMYFAWYAAEELGLIGSQYVVKSFIDKKIPLRGALQFDMTGYQKTPENKVWIMDDYVDASLAQFVSDIATNYAKVEIGHTKCGYACSDHASWNAKGYRSAMAFEAKFGEDSPYIHTTNDTINFISLDHMARFAVIGVSFMSELAEPL